MEVATWRLMSVKRQAALEKVSLTTSGISLLGTSARTGSSMKRSMTTATSEATLVTKSTGTYGFGAYTTVQHPTNGTVAW